MKTNGEFKVGDNVTVADDRHVGEVGTVTHIDLLDDDFPYKSFT